MRKEVALTEGQSYHPSPEFGSLNGERNAFTFTISMEVTMFQIPVYYYHRETDDGYLQIARAMSKGEIEGVVARFKRTDADLKTDITKVLKERIHGGLGFDGLPGYEESPVYTKAEFEAILQEIRDEEEERKAAIPKRTAFIDFLEAQGMNPRHCDGNAHSWVANCAQGEHFMAVSTKDDTWGCGYHKRKGGQKDLENWLRELGTFNA